MRKERSYVTIPPMPIIQSAIKKVRKDKLRTARNKKREDALKILIKRVRTTKAVKDIQAAFSALDKAAKVKLIHPNKAARLKSRLSKGIQMRITPKGVIKKSAKKRSSSI